MSKTRIYLIVATLLLVIVGVLGAMPAMMSPMMFDSPGSDENPGTLLLFYSMVSFPAVCILAIPLAWITHALKRDRIAILCTLLPLANILLGSLALLYLILFNEGNFGD